MWFYIESVILLLRQLIINALFQLSSTYTFGSGENLKFRQSITGNIRLIPNISGFYITKFVINFLFRIKLPINQVIFIMVCLSDSFCAQNQPKTYKRSKS